jgi:hypothetical protein
MTTQNSLLKSLSRRNLLQHAPLLGLLAPVFRRRDAGAAALAPRRVILIFSPNGNMEQIGPATGTETAFTISDWWKPLERHKADGIFMSHMASTGSGIVNGGGHGLGGQTFGGWGAGVQDIYAQQGETIDQVIGKRLEAENRGGVKRSLVWGLQKNSSAGGTGDAFATAANRNITPETDPSKAWAELFASFMAPTPNAVDTKRAAALIARDQSILDFVGKDCNGLKGQLGAEGTRLLDEHCNSIRSMEMALKNGAMPGAASSCAKPADPGAKNWVEAANSDASPAAFTTLIANTLACELSHVIAFQFGAQGARNSLASSYGVPSSPLADSGDSGATHHPWTHQGRSAARTTAMRTFNLYYSEKIALLVDKLKTTIDASGKPLLDSTVVLWIPELGGAPSNQDAHQTGQLPIAMFGNGQGTFKTGRYLRGKSDPNNNHTDSGNYGDQDKEPGRDTAKILISMMQYMGLKDVNTVGKSDAKGTFPFLYGA